MLKFHKGVALLMGLVFVSPFYGQGENVGSRIVIPFQIAMSARQVGMGDVFVAFGDENAMLYNPAGLIFVPRMALVGSHNNWLLDMYQTYFGYVVPTQRGVFGVGSVYFNEGKFDIIENGTPTGEQAAVYEFAPVLSYGTRLHKYLAVGVSGKFIHFNLASYVSSAFAVDVGVMMPPVEVFNGRGLLSLGAVLKDYGTRVRFVEQSFDLPWEARFGVGLQFPDVSMFDVLMGAEVRYPSFNDYRYNVGLEVWVNKMVALRMGYLGGPGYSLLGEMSDATRATFGIGVRINRFKVDYAYASLGDVLGPVHRLTLSIGLGVEKPHPPVRIVPEQMEEIKGAIQSGVEELKGDITDVRMEVEEIKEILKTSLKTVIGPDEILHLLSIHFAFGSAEIPDAEYPKLYEALRLIKKYYEGKEIVIEGHTDEAGTEQANMELGLRRAEAVKAFLVENGVPEELIKVVSKGESEVLSHRSGPGVRGIENRRVVFVVAPEEMMN